MVDESSGACLCRRVFHRYDLRPACEVVNDREVVDPVLCGWDGADNVNMDAADASVWRMPHSERGMDMAPDLRGLVGMAFLAPAANVTLETVPYEVGGDSSLRWFASEVRESVDDLKGTPYPRRWNDRVCIFRWRCRRRRYYPERNVSEAETSSGSLVGSDIVRIHLIVGQVMVVDCTEIDRRQTIGMGQGVVDNIYLAFDVVHVRGELGNEGEVSGLPR